MQLVSDRRLGGLNRWRLVESAGELMQVPDEMRKCVAFLWYKNAQGQPRLAGTAFFVAVEEEDCKEVGFIYVVTAKHVIAAARINSGTGSIFILISRLTHPR